MATETSIFMLWRTRSAVVVSSRAMAVGWRLRAGLRERQELARQVGGPLELDDQVEELPHRLLGVLLAQPQAGVAWMPASRLLNS